MIKGLLDPKKDMLVAWTEFLKDPESEKVRNLEMTVEEIRRAKDQLVMIILKFVNLLLKYISCILKADLMFI